ncbi:LysE family translocator [Persicitalea sp.]|uniref:LysE family translocator n=1 Tax=Persicitalea sp. TaxID=3100273 RepID=UPI0035941DF8
MEELKPLLLFGVTLVVSFVGSLQLGPANLAVIHTSLTEGPSASWRTALGGALPELLYAGLAAYTIVSLQGAFEWHYSSWVVNTALLLIGCYWVVQKTTPIKDDLSNPATNHRAALLRGLVAGLLNPQLYPFWVLILAGYRNYPLLSVQTIAESAGFAAGAVVGAFGLLGLVAWLTDRYRENIARKLTRWPIQRILGGMLIILAVIGFARL